MIAIRRFTIGKVGLLLCSSVVGVLTGCVYEQRSAPPVQAAVAVSYPGVEIRVESDFYEPLTPYGRWEVVGTYGRCWIPGRVEADWRPYYISQEPGKPATAVPKGPDFKPAFPRQAIEPLTTNPFQVVRVIITPLLGPLGTAALVLLLVIFMLLKREDLRSRLIRLIGRGRISSTSHAMDEAGVRVTRYLLILLLLNVTYGITVAVGLYFIGVPNAILWGASAAVLRFIPYIGAWVGAAIPIMLSLAVAPGWLMPLLTVGFFVVLELLNNNVLEPWIYGSNTGLAPVALIFSAVCWTWLWGPVGLVLATPLTVCLVVMGRHIPRLSFLSVLLSDEEALTPAQDCYYRLLTVGEHDEMGLVEDYLKTNSLTALYDSVLIPVITAAEVDHRQDLLDDGQHAFVQQSLRDIVADLGARSPVTSGIIAEKAVAPPAHGPCCRKGVFQITAEGVTRGQLAEKPINQDPKTHSNRCARFHRRSFPHPSHVNCRTLGTWVIVAPWLQDPYQ